MTTPLSKANTGTSPDTKVEDTKLALILVIEDELDISDLIASTLQSYGFRCECCRTGTDGLARAATTMPALCIVDLGLPDMDGLQLVRSLQDLCDPAIVILTGRQQLADRVVGLELGADDYMGKPFEPRELVARVRSILRRLGRNPSVPVSAAPVEPALKTATGNGDMVARFEGWQFIPARNLLLSPEGEECALSTAETRLLDILLRGANRILSRDQLLGSALDPSDRAIDVRISRLRRKLSEDPQSPRLIKTVYGAGYVFSAEVHWYRLQPALPA